MAVKPDLLVGVMRQLNEAGVTPSQFVERFTAEDLDWLCEDLQMSMVEVLGLAGHLGATRAASRDAGDGDDDSGALTTAQEARRHLEAMRADFWARFPKVKIDQAEYDAAVARQGGVNPFL